MFHVYLSMSKLKNNIEVEVRSFITKKQYENFLKYFKTNGKFLGKENQITYYLAGPNDLRIQKTNNLAKLWLKGGKIHAKFREDIVVRCDREDFEKLEELLLKLGYKVQIKWFRTRNDFLWKSIRVSVDFTRGYGYIIELEKMAAEKDKEKIYHFLLGKLKTLGIKPTPKQELDKKFNYYKKNWGKLISTDDR